MSLKLEITCPGCQHTFRERASKVKPGQSRACPHCGRMIEYGGDNLSKMDRDIKRALADVKKAFKGHRP
jgi:endogenous inhibitor of DNA gyrase (YacG/DUF329 family)